MSWSKVAFGAAKCAKGVAEHEAAFTRALKGGITAVVDTSANYMGGNSELLVGEGVDRWRTSGGGEDKDLTVVSKFGYASADSKLPGVVQVAPGLSHSLHPDFYRHELTGSTKRLGETAINAYLVEHPEHHLALKLGLAGQNASVTGNGSGAAPPSQMRLEEARSSFYEEMTALFQAMEGNVGEHGAGEGRAYAYGVSSLGLSLPTWDPMHVSWEKLVECAEQAASKAGRDRHSFKIVQMPANLLEITGLATAPAMQKAGLKVMACHPLRAATAEGKFELVDDALRGGLPTDYMDVCREVLEHFNLEIPEGREPTEEEEEIRQGCRFLQQLVQDMNAQLTSFTSLEHYEAELGGSITPMIADKFEALDEDSADLLQKFFDRYGKMVRYSCAQRVRDMVVTGEGCPSGAHALGEADPLQVYALRWLRKSPGVSCTVVEMDQPNLVEEAFLSLRRD
ncbi:unnamed protein product [Scytosiphon promiscuus]